MRYVINPPDLPEHFYGYGAALSICHTLNCKKGGLITERHNKLSGGVSNLASKAFTPMNIHEDPKIFTGRVVRGGKAAAKVKGGLPKDKR